MNAMFTDKNEIRQSLRKKRLELNIETRSQHSQTIANIIFHLPIFQKSDHMAFYLANDGEIDPTPILLTAEEQQKRCYLPVLKKELQLMFYTFHSNDPLITNTYGIGEPDTRKQKSIDPTQLDCVFVPLVAFDENGNRIGRGAGYYDRSFHFLNHTRKTKPLLIGLAHEFQKLELIIPEAWDVPLDFIVTEKRVYNPTQ